MTHELTQERLKELLHYDPETGAFTRRTTQCGNAMAGRTVGVGRAGTYGRIMLDFIRYPAHRVAWFYVHGVWPKGEIDHIDRNRGNNQIINLADVTRAENQQNVRRRASNTSGFAGVYYFKSQRKWTASIQHNNVRKCLGYFKTPEEAAECYIVAKAATHTHSPEIKL